MSIPIEKERVIDTFIAKELAKGSKTVLNNTRTYRALNGKLEYTKDDSLPENDPITIQYKEYLKIKD